MKQTESHDLAEQAIAHARELGASAAQCSIASGSGLGVTVRQGDVETIEHSRDQGFSISVFRGQRKGSASTNDLTLDAVLQTVADACELATHGAEDECAGLADAELMATEVPDLDLYHEWTLDAEAAIDIAKQVEASAFATDPRIANSEGASVSTRSGLSTYANSHGFIGQQRSSRHSVSCVVIAGEGSGMQRDYWYSSARAPDDLEDHEAIGRRAAERTVRRLEPTKLTTRKVPVVYAAEVAGGLVSHFLGAISGGSLYRKASFMLDMLDEQVFPEWLSISENPRLPRGLGSSAYDSEGVATRDRVLVENGVLQSYLLGAYSARKLGMQSTGNAGGARNVRLQPGSRTGATDALAQMGTGLLVTELIGMGVNGVTGDYSRGASGFWVEDGVICYPVQEITIAGNLRQMYQDIVTAGDDIDMRGNVHCGSVLIAEMSVAGA
jgi:PmbA protein